MADIYICACDIETNLRKSFFAEYKDEDKFVEYINDHLPDTLDTPEVAFTVDNVPSDIVSRLYVHPYWFASNHTLEIRIHADHELTYEEWDLLANDDSFYDYLDREVVPAFIEWFNSQDFGITFPISTWDNFDEFHFDGENFFVMLYTPDNGEFRYAAFTPKVGTLYLINDFKISF